jgi:hypothetical protein
VEGNIKNCVLELRQNLQIDHSHVRTTHVRRRGSWRRRMIIRRRRRRRTRSDNVYIICCAPTAHAPPSG